MQLKYIDNSLREKWEKLVSNTPESGFMQTFLWADFRRQTGWKTFKIGLFEKEKLIGGAIIMKFFFENSSFLYIPEGPVFDYENPNTEQNFKLLIKEINKLVTETQDFKTTHLRIEPRLSKLPLYFKNFQKAPTDMEPKQTLMIDLVQSEDQILASMKPKGRYNIKIAQKCGIKVTSGLDESYLNVFLSLYNQTKQRNNFEGKKDWYFTVLYRLLINNPKRGKFYLASLNNKPLACALVMFFGQRASYFFGGSAATDKEKMASYLLHWQIIKDAKSQGFKWYDLWGISQNEKLQDSWSGFTRFKRQFGGERFDFIGCYDLVYETTSTNTLPV